MWLGQQRVICSLLSAWSYPLGWFPGMSLPVPCVPRSTEAKMPLVRRGPRMGDTGCAGRAAAPYLPPAGTG